MPASPNEAVNRTPPCNLDAERAVLGACMLDAVAANNIHGLLRAGDFFSPKHRQIFACVEKMMDEAEPCDPVTVGEALKAAGQLDDIGGMAYLSGLLDAVPSPSAISHYAEIVADKARKRRMLSICSEIESNAYGESLDGLGLMSFAEERIFAEAQGRQRGDFIPLSELLPDVYIKLGNIRESGGISGVPTFPDLDKLFLSGLQKSDLIILAARPGVGKTSMALNIAQNAAARNGMTVAVFSLEMPREQLVQRMLCTEAEVDHSRARKGQISKNDLSRLKKAVTTLTKAAVYIDDTMMISVPEMRSKCRKLKLEHGLDLVVVDYIQLMQSSGSRHVENRQLEVAEMSRGLKAMAKELDVPVLALSQLSRLADRTNDAPNLSHLRESGALEQDADVVIMLHQPKGPEGKENAFDDSELKKSKDGDVIQVIVAKHRNGPTGGVEMLFLKQYTAFRDLSQSWVEEREAPPERAGAVGPE